MLVKIGLGALGRPKNYFRGANKINTIQTVAVKEIELPQMSSLVPSSSHAGTLNLNEIKHVKCHASTDHSELVWGVMQKWKHWLA